MSSNPQFLTFFLPLFFLPSFLSLPNPDPLTLQPLSVTQSPPATIPAFPEQSDIAACPLNLSDQLFHGIKTACSGAASEKLHRSRCCPVLAAWLYAAYSATALEKAGRSGSAMAAGRSTPSYNMPLLPDDSDTCVNNFGKALNERGIELVKPNMTCDVLSCYCGIRLHPLSCPEAFSVNQKGKLVGNESVKRLERDCLSSSVHVNGFPGLGGCSKCLHSLQQLKKKKTLNPIKKENRTAEMHNKECQVMGLTWLLAKNQTAYIHTVSSVLRATMMSTDGSDPLSCALNSDGMPLAVDSSDFSNSSSLIDRTPLFRFELLLCLLCMHFMVLFIKY